MAMSVLISLIILIWTCRISLTWYRPTWRKNWFDSNSREYACPTAHVMGIHVSSFWWLTQRHWGSINYAECKMAFICVSRLWWACLAYLLWQKSLSQQKTGKIGTETCP